MLAIVALVVGRRVFVVDAQDEVGLAVAGMDALDDKLADAGEVDGSGGLQLDRQLAGAELARLRRDRNGGEERHAKRAHAGGDVAHAQFSHYRLSNARRASSARATHVSDATRA